MDLGIKGRRALVTGASSGLGAAAALALAREGVEVVINSRNEANLKPVAKSIRESTGISPAIVVGDVSNEKDLSRIVAEAGQIDILISNSGGPPSGNFTDITKEQWQGAVELLLHSAVGLTRGVLDGMRRRKWGRIIYITSVSVLEPINDLLLSNAIRAAVAGLCKTISNNYAVDGITANCVCPGYTNTERLRSLAEKRAGRTGQTVDEVLMGFAQSAPAGRLGEPDELGALIAFLASERAAYITGTAIPVDGGAVRSIV